MMILTPNVFKGLFGPEWNWGWGSSILRVLSFPSEDAGRVSIVGGPSFPCAAMCSRIRRPKKDIHHFWS